MNYILFYEHECKAENGTVSDTQTYTIHITAYDIRAKHITSILSAKEGTELAAGIIDRGFGTATILALDNNSIDICFRLETPCSPKPHRSTIVLAHPRPPVMARLLRDITTMAVSNIICYVPDLGEKSYLNAAFWHKSNELLLQGAMQGKECFLPSVNTCIGLKNALSLLDTCTQKEPRSQHRISIILQQQSASPLLALLQKTIQHKTHAISPASIQTSPNTFHFIYFIGPERQYSKTEETILETLHLDSAHLGSHTLRSEVAALVVQGIWNLLWET